MSAPAREPFVMPDWMEPYRELIESDLGGNTTENLLNDTTTNGFNNAIRAALICMADSKVSLLHGLHRRGLLAAAPDPRGGRA
jgi:hypothetical protein